MLSILLVGLILSSGILIYSNSNFKESEDPFFESFYLSISTNWDNWDKIISRQYITCWSHKHTKLQFCIQGWRNNDYLYINPPCIYRKQDISSDVEVIHTFTNSQLKKVKQFLKDREIEQLFDTGVM